MLQWFSKNYRVQGFEVRNDPCSQENWFPVLSSNTKLGGFCWLRLIVIRAWICAHNDVIKWKHFPRYWSFVRGIHRWPVISPHNDQWRGALMFSLSCASINGWVNTGEADDLRRHRAHYDVTLMYIQFLFNVIIHAYNNVYQRLN